MSEERRELFQKDFEEIVCRQFGKTRKARREEQDDFDNEREKFAVQMGLNEITSIRDTLKKLKTSLKDKVLASNLISEIEEIDRGFEYMSKVLKWDFDPIKMINSKGPDSYRNLLYVRKQWIADILRKYDVGPEGETTDI